MFVQCRSLFTGEATRLQLDTELDFTRVEFQGMTPFAQPVRVEGDIMARAGVVKLSAKAVFTFHGRCDRCLAPFTRAYEVPLEHILVTSLENEDSDYVLLEDYRLALDELVQAAIFLELPYKSLCREDCLGLCPQCGKDLNEGPCGCTKKTVDPRLEILSQLLN